MTDAERKLWSALRRKHLKRARFRRQVALGKYIVDFCCLAPRLVVEVDGGQHADNRAYDEQRSRFLASRGFRVLRFWNGDVLKNPAGVIEAILTSLAAADVRSSGPTGPPSAPSPATERGKEKMEDLPHNEREEKRGVSLPSK